MLTRLKVLWWKIFPLFARWVFADPGLDPMCSYCPFIFMFQVFHGTAEDSYLALTFVKSTADRAISKAITVQSFDNPVTIQLSYDGTNYEAEIDIEGNEYWHKNFSCKGARIKNQTVGLNARFQFIAWYVVSEYAKAVDD